MNEEEKKAIEYSKNCLMKITLGIDCEFDVNILDTLLNIIKKLKKESEELKNQEATQKKINELLVQRYSNSISVQKVKDKIEEILNNGEYRIIFEGDSEFPDEATCIDAQKYIKLEKLQELIEGRKENESN